MTRKCLATFAAVLMLFATAAPALAQTTTMETREGSRHIGPGLIIGPSSATFAIGVTRDNGASFITSASVADTVEIRAEIRPEAADVGLSGDIFVVDRLLDDSGNTLGFTMRTTDNVWVPWDTFFTRLQPYRTGQTLAQNLPVTLFNGTLGTTGNHRIFVGYKGPDGVLKFNPMPQPITITAAQTESPLVQAQAMFAAKISPNIVSICVSCHLEGGIGGGVHTFVGGSSQAALDADFATMRGLASRGKAFILDQVGAPGTSHLGGQVVPQGTQSYADFSAFLTLLEQL